ncbi:MAG: hypothetical protein ACYC1L_19390 [Alphaproteobacteria bacterium]
MNTKEQFTQIAEALESAAFDRGWNAAMAAMKESIAQLKPRGMAPSGSPVATIKFPTGELIALDMPRGPTKETAADAALRVMRQRPGVLGTEIIKAVAPDGINGNSVRTALRRIKERKLAHQVGKKWFITNEAPSS